MSESNELLIPEGAQALADLSNIDAKDMLAVDSAYVRPTVRTGDLIKIADEAGCTLEGVVCDILVRRRTFKADIRTYYIRTYKDTWSEPSE